MGDFINGILDELHALLDRISLFPMAFQLLFWILLVGGSTFFLLLMFERRGIFIGGKKNPYLIASGVLISSILVFSMLLIDRRYNQIELLQLHSARQTVIKPDSTGSESYFPGVKQNLMSIPDLKIDDIRIIQDSAGLEIIRISSNNPVFTAYVATVDLTQTKIKLQYPIDIKTKTSDFAKAHDLDFAINGEAGENPGLEAPLGQWTGNYIVEGSAIKLDDNKRRPFMYFDTNSRAGYSCDTCVVKKPTPDMYNAIWGRFDLVRNGAIGLDQRDYSRDRPYPRTIMAFDKKGERGFFMIVDGRKPRYSMGLKLESCAKIMLALGAYNGMACDQGGSSLIYSKKLGIINRPADGGERAVYTHFGFKIEAKKP